MAKPRTETFLCPACHKRSTITIQDTVSTSRTPAQAALLQAGALFRFTCPHCGEKHPVNYSIFYHDTAHKAMVCYVRPEAASVMEARFASLEGKGASLTGYHCRIVTSQEALREKAAIFACGLDDRVIECMKVALAALYTSRNPGESLSGGRFFDAGDSFLLRFDGEEPIAMTFTREQYHRFRNRNLPQLSQEPDRQRYVDLAWAGWRMQKPEKAAASF